MVNWPVPAAEATAVLENGAETLFLGLRGGVAHFAIDLSHVEDPHGAFGLAPAAKFVELRDVGPDLAPEEGGLLAYARGLAHWHRTHRFCGRCGAPTTVREAGHVRACTNPDCRAQHFPRTDPAVIMLVSQGDRALLGRKSDWPAGRYSALAGFVEPGETLEGAVAREVMGELGSADVALAAISKGPDRNAGREHFHMPDRPSFMLAARGPVRPPGQGVGGRERRPADLLQGWAA